MAASNCKIIGVRFERERGHRYNWSPFLEKPTSVLIILESFVYLNLVLFSEKQNDSEAPAGLFFIAELSPHIGYNNEGFTR
jgi:hypothetical protein